MTLVSVRQPSRDDTLTTGTSVSFLHDFPPNERKGRPPKAFKGDSCLRVCVSLSAGGPMTALQVLRFEAALWGIAEEAAFAGQPRPGRSDTCLAAEPASPKEKLISACAFRVGCELQRWLDLSA